MTDPRYFVQVRFDDSDGWFTISEEPEDLCREMVEMIVEESHRHHPKGVIVDARVARTTIPRRA